MFSPDIYLSGDETYQRIVDAYTRADNPLFVPENSHEPQFAREIFRVIGNGGIGYAVWGIDDTNIDSAIDPSGKSLLPPYGGFSRIFKLLGGMQELLAALTYAGKVKTVLEDEPQQGRIMQFGKWEAVATFGVREEGESDNTPGPHGVLLVTQLSENEFLVTGYDARVEFHLAYPSPAERWQILHVEDGYYTDGKWQVRRWLNGDECDFGVNLGAASQILHFQMGTY